jgi:hypothetical protein
MAAEYSTQFVFGALNGAERRELSLTGADVNREMRKSFWQSVPIEQRWKCAAQKPISAFWPIETLQLF